MLVSDFCKILMLRNHNKQAGDVLKGNETEYRVSDTLTLHINL